MIHHAQELQVYSQVPTLFNKLMQQPGIKDFVTQVSEAEKTKTQQEMHKNHLVQTLQSLQYMKSVCQPSQYELTKRSVELPQSRHRKTIIFDLDETLVHCIDDIENSQFDLPISVTFPTGETIDAGINVRPYTYECLKKAQQNYQVVVFTASH